MENKSAYVRFAACALCAGVVCGGAGCKQDEAPPKPATGNVPVTLGLDSEGNATFLDSSGKTESTLTIGKGSCVGSAEGKASFRQQLCSFSPESANVKGDTVIAYWESPSGDTSRNGDNMTINQNLVLRVIKAGADGYDCASAPVSLRASARVNTRAGEEVVFSPQGEVITFSGKNCPDNQRKALETALYRVRDFKFNIRVACW